MSAKPCTECGLQHPMWQLCADAAKERKSRLDVQTSKASASIQVHKAAPASVSDARESRPPRVSDAVSDAVSDVSDVSDARPKPAVTHAERQRLWRKRHPDKHAQQQRAHRAKQAASTTGSVANSTIADVEKYTGPGHPATPENRGGEGSRAGVPSLRFSPRMLAASSDE